jgi:hypothetical protein
LDAVTGTHELELALPHAGWLRRLERLFAREALLLGIVGLVVAVWAFAATYWIAADTWLALVGGREVASRGIPHVDTLTVVGMGRSWIDEQWLAQVILWHVSRLGGLRLLVLLEIVLLACPLVLAIAVARRRGAAPRTIAPFVLLPLPVFSSFVRPQLFSQTLFVCLLVLLVSESRRPSRRVFLALPLLVVWANLHGAVVEGAALVALLGVTELVRPVRRLRGAVLLAAPWACLLATPYGTSILTYYRATLWNTALRQTQPEWMAPTHSAVAALIVFPLLASALVLVVRQRRQLTTFEVGALALTAAGALTSTRSVVWFAYGSLALLPPLARRRERTPRKASRVAVAFALAATVAAAAGLVDAGASPASRFDRRWPPTAAAAVRVAAAREPGLRVFASPEYADWLLYEIPALRGRVAFDGRWELLPESKTLAIWRSLQEKPPGGSPAEGYGLLVLDPQREAMLVSSSIARGDVRVLYRTKEIVVLRRGRTRWTS